MRRSLLALGLAVWTAAAALPVAAQETRAGVLERQRAEKAARAEPYKHNAVEKALLYVEEHDPLRKIAPYNGFYVQYGYTNKPVGSGIAFGGGFRHDLFNRRARLVTEAGASLRGYQLYRADFALPRLAGERFELGIEGNYRRNPQEDFFGRGLESRREDRTNYRYDNREVQGRAVFKPSRWGRLGTRFGYLGTSTGRGTDARFPSIETRFGDADAPGLGAEPSYTYTELFAAADTRDQPGNARAGGYYAAAWRKYNDRDLDAFSFGTFDAEIQQFFPIFDKKRVIAVRAHYVATSSDEGHRVPYFMMPTLGGADTLRSVSDYRFRDANMMLVNLEYRWEAFSGLDMALFTDLGKVGASASDLDFGSVKHAYGIGLRFNTYKAVFLRMDIGHGAGEGLHLYLKFSKAF
jgi:outer membrane translocation and assembly module TamA